MAQVHPYLVGASGFQHAADQRYGIMPGLQALIAGHGMPALCTDRHFLAVDGVAGDRRIDMPAQLRRNSPA